MYQLTHRNGVTIPVSFTLAEWFQRTFVGGIAGLALSRISRSIDPHFAFKLGLVMGQLGAVRVRVLGNEVKRYQANTTSVRRLLRAVFGFQALVMATPVLFGIAMRASYWRQGLRFFCWHQGLGLSVSLAVLGMNRGWMNEPLLVLETMMTDPCPQLAMDLAERVGRPKTYKGLQMSNQLRQGVEIQLKDPQSLTHIDMLSDVCASYLTEDSKQKIKQAEKQLRDTDSKSDYYSLMRNLAYHFTQLKGEEEQRVLAKDISDAFNGCEVRRVSVLYALLLRISPGKKEKVGVSGGLVILRNHIAQRHQAFKYERLPNIVQHVQPLIMDVCMGDDAHRWAAFVASCGSGFGLAAPVDARAAWHNTFKGGGAAIAEAVDRFVERQFRGPNRYFWIQAVRGRYPIQELIEEIKACINMDQGLVEYATYAVAEALADKAPKDYERDVTDLVVNEYCEPTSVGGSYKPLNEEGIILLLKLTGDLVNDGRLHTQKEPSELFAGEQV